jgi:hypothetical protein
MDRCVSDLAYWLYVFTILISIYGTSLFVWWWVKMGKASAVYVYVTLLIIGEGISSGMSLYARHLFLTDGYEVYTAYLKSGVWPYRHLLVFMALVMLVGHMSYRAFRSER